MSTGLLGFVLGMSCFGVAMKLLEYENSPSLPPKLVGIPMLGAGIAGMVGGRMRKHWLVSLHTIFCLIAGVLSLHLVFLFLGRESDSREIYKAKCQSNFKGSCEFVIVPLLLRFNSFPATNYSQLDCHPRLQLLKIHFL